MRVSFTDDAGNEETLTSDATSVVAAATVADTLVGITLVDTSGQSAVATLTDGATVTLDDPANGSYGIRVDVAENAEVGSVHLELSGSKTVSQTENIPPHSLYGDDGGNLNGEGLPVGSYTLRATAYSEDNLGGDELQALEISFTVAETNSAATGQPTISGTLQVGETLRADTAGVADEDGLQSMSYTYQWLADDTDVAGATGDSYTLTDSEEGKAIKVRVSFTDDAGNQETLTSAATAAVVAAPSANNEATGAPAINGIARVGHVLTADITGISDQDGMEDAEFTYAWLAGDTAIGDATGSAYLLTAAEKDKTITVRVSFTDDQDNSESLVSAATVAVTTSPLTASLQNEPQAHDGENGFTFELVFSEHVPDMSYVALRDNAFPVVGGEVTKARRVDRDSITRNVLWEITVTPNGNGDVAVTLPETTGCDTAGAICTGDGRKLSNQNELTVSGPSN